MRISEIQNGTVLFFPNVLENKVWKFNVANIRKGSEDEGLFECRLQTDETEQLFYAKLWELPEDNRKSPDHLELFLPYYVQIGYAGMLSFYFAETTAHNALRELKK